MAKLKIKNTVKSKAQPKVKKKALSEKKIGAAPVKPKSIVLSRAKQLSAKPKLSNSTKVRVVNKIVSPSIASREERRLSKGLRLPQYNYMKPPGLAHNFQVGDKVEVYCDHEKNRDRIRGWIQGVVVQVDNKLVAVQFRSNVYLTDGWMVPDRILWYPLTSEHMRPVPGKKSAKREEKFIPDY